MDQKSSSLWKTKSIEKTLATGRKTNNSFISNEEEETEEHVLLTEKEELERDVRISKDKLSSALSECSSKDQMKIAQEAIAGWEKAKIEALSLEKDLDKVLQQKAACEERSSHLEKAFKDCTQQLHFVREQQERRVHSAVMKTSQEFEKTIIALEERLAEAGKKITKLDAENTQFKKFLLRKDKVIEELSRYRSQVEADLDALILRLEPIEKENASLKYEIRVLERELEIRHEEREVNRRTTDVAQKQHQESVEKIAKLESECQKLRLLVRKRLPGPAALTRMKNEVEGHEKEQVETLRRKSDHSLIRSMDYRVDVVATDTPTKRINFLTDQLQKMEEENRSLKYALNKKSSGQIEESSKGQIITVSAKYPFFLQEHSVATLSDLGSDEKASCAESWAEALISELEIFKNEKTSVTPSHKYMKTSDMNLMDDFAEMEKLAYSPVVNKHVSQALEDKAFNLDASDIGNGNDSSTTKNVSIPIQKILELLDGINVRSRDTSVAKSLPGKGDKFLPCKNEVTPTGNNVRVFKWETTELSAVLQPFVQTCNDLLSGKADLEQFAQSVASNLEWIINHCFSFQEVLSMKDDGGSVNNFAESNKLNIQIENMSYLQPNTEEEAKTLNIKTEKESSVVDREGGRQSQSEMPTVRQSEGDIGEQTEKQGIMQQDIETQLVESNLEWRKPSHKISHPKNDPANNIQSLIELDETCIDLKTQLKGKTNKEVPDDGKQLQNEWEITSASEKLAECQETIRNLGKQLKELASSKDAALFDKVILTPADPFITSKSSPQRNGSQRLSLLDKMLAEDNNVQIGASPRTKEAIQNGHTNSAISTNAATESKFTHSDADRNAVVTMAIVPLKKIEGRSFLKKLLWRLKKGNSKKTSFS